MAAPTWAQLAAWTTSEYDREMIDYMFLKGPHLLRELRLVPTKGGKTFVQTMHDEANTAQWATYWDSFSNNTPTYKRFEAFLARIIEQTQLTAPVGTLRDLLTNLPDLVAEHKDFVVTSVCNKLRDNYIVGQPASGAIGANLTTLGITGIDAGPRIVLLDDAHNETAVVARNHGFKWTLATKALQWMAYGETDYGPANTLSATNYYRAKLFNTAGTKWIWVTVDWSTISVAADFESTIATDADCWKVTPSKQMTGLATLCHPSRVMYGNLSQVMPSAAGDSLTWLPLSWLAKMLKRAANGNADRCLMVTSMELCLRTEAVLNSLATGERKATFMGKEMDLAVGGVGMIDEAQILNDRVAPDATTGLGRIVGVVIGNEEDGAHLRYNSVSSLPIIQQMPDMTAGGAVDPGDGVPIPFPYTAYIVPPDKDNEHFYPRASMMIEGSCARFDNVITLDCLKLT